MLGVMLSGLVLPGWPTHPVFPLSTNTYERPREPFGMDSPIVASVGGVDIWKEGDKYETYDGMIPLEEFDSLEAAKRAARSYGDSGLPL